MDKFRIALTVLITTIAMGTLCGCRRDEAAATPSEGKSHGSEHAQVEEYVKGEELLCLADSEEEAKEIADMYGVDLVSFSYGVATFHTDDDPQDVIKYGIEQGYPVLEINGYSSIQEGTK